MSRAISIRRGKTHRLPAPRSRSLRGGGLTSGDDADVSLVHARVFILFPRMSQEGWEGVRPGSSCCSLQFGGREKEKEVTVRCEQKTLAQAVGLFFYPRRKNKKYPFKVSAWKTKGKKVSPRPTLRLATEWECAREPLNFWKKSPGNQPERRAWTNRSAPSLPTPAICFRWGQMDTRDKSNGFRKCHRMHRIPQQGYIKKEKVECIRDKFHVERFHNKTAHLCWLVKSNAPRRESLSGLTRGRDTKLNLEYQI